MQPSITSVDVMPATLISRLSESAQKSLTESVREKRLALLASGLGLGEAGALDALARTTGLPVLEAPQVDPEALAAFPARLAHEYQVVPVQVVSNPESEISNPKALHLATPWPPNSTIADWIATFTPRPLVWHLAPADRVQQLINENYGVGSGSLDDADDSALVPATTGTELEADADAAVVRFVTEVIAQAVAENATDIHFEPQEGQLTIRYRVDGLLVPVPLPENLLRFQDAIISRLKIMARMNISQKRLPQDGRIDFRQGGAAFLRKINSSDLRIVTIEDPIEYEVPGANQMQTHAEIGLTFASALRHVLRQDPDVIMVGEIRDLDTAEIAIRASLTGHLVFSTLHTNDAPGAITRLTDMGVEPFLVASAVELVIAQRLVRRLCPDCAKRVPCDPAALRTTLEALQLAPAEADGITELFEPVGCRSCRQTGFRGRIGLFEILHPKLLHDLIVRRESSKALATLARSHGMRTLQQSGWERVKTGHTSLQELLRTISTSGD
ncbi:MAG: type II/IV secretion system protein [Opitutae bacterium]|nr:type II/IV secretion system protein [Opitutae bacterium]